MVTECTFLSFALFPPLLSVGQSIAMASSYTSPLTVVRDVETSILGGAVLESLRAGGHSREDGKKKGSGGGGGVRTVGLGKGEEYPEGSNKLQSMSTQENTGGLVGWGGEKWSGK